MSLYTDENYIINIRRELHRFPEIGYDLPRTLAIVKRELEKLGLSYTEEYGKSSVVSYITPQKFQQFIIAKISIFYNINRLNNEDYQKYFLGC